MKPLQTCLLFACAFISARAQSLEPSDVLKQDGVLRISDGSSYYELSTNGTFKSFLVGESGRRFTGTWTSGADPDLHLNPTILHFTVTAKNGWMNGFQRRPDDWRLVFSVYPGVRHPADRLHPATFDCYWIFDELKKIPADATRIPAPLKSPSAGAVAWGKAVDGLEVGISCDCSITNSREFPDLFFYVVNAGDKDIPDIIQSDELCILTVNGRHYAQDFYGGKSSYMPPGRKYGPIPIEADRLGRIPELRARPPIRQSAPRPGLQKGTNTVSIQYMLDERQLVASGEIQIIAK